MRWWEEETIPADVAGVFEGGGAKGLAYVGATRALQDRGHWFCAVAGASAGAITAALIAAGATPDQLESWTQEGLGTLAGQLARPSKADGRLARARFAWRALSHLGSPTSAAIATSDELGTWLRRCLATLVGDGNVTFGGLFDATGIELTVVAVDLIARKHRIFCHSWTKDIPVADAVVASSSIPFALPAKRLSMKADVRYGNPVVDGGVWTNFPTFVFRDHKFRTHHKLPDIGDRPVIGFLLDEQTGEYIPEIDQPFAFGHVPADLRKEVEGGLRPAELLLSYDDDVIDNAIHGRVTPLLTAVTPELVQEIGDTTRVSGFRTTRRAPPGKSVDIAERARHGRRPFLSLILLGLGLVAQPLVLVALLAGTLVSSIGLLSAVIDRKPNGVGWQIGWGVGLIIAVVIITSTFVLSIVLLVAHSATHWPMRKYGILLAATYTAGSGAPYWSGRAVGESDDGVIRLPIPEELTTMSFVVTAECRGRGRAQRL